MVTQEAKRLIVCQGVTNVASGLVEGMRSLEEIWLAPGVKRIDSNVCHKVHTLVTGREFQSCELRSGDLRSLVIAPNVYIGSDYRGSVCLHSSDDAIQQMIHESIVNTFGSDMRQLFRDLPEIGKAIGRLGRYDVAFAAGNRFLSGWNDKYKTSRYVPERDLWQLLGIQRTHAKIECLELNLLSSSGIGLHVALAAVFHAARRCRARTVDVKTNYYFSSEFPTAVDRWWKAEMPGVALKITEQRSGAVLVDTARS